MSDYAGGRCLVHHVKSDVSFFTQTEQPNGYVNKAADTFDFDFQNTVWK